MSLTPQRSGLHGTIEEIGSNRPPERTENPGGSKQTGTIPGAAVARFQLPSGEWFTVDAEDAEHPVEFVAAPANAAARETA